MANEREIDLPTLLRFTQKIGASDLHLSAGAPPMVRLHGETRKLEIDGVDLSLPSVVRSVIYGFLTDVQKKRLENDWELDCSLEIGEDARFRANVFFQARGLAGVFRTIPTRIPTADELGLPPVVRDLGKLHRGLCLVTGPTGSGKSTTLAAVIDSINASRRGHIITIEDPIEFVHTPKRCMVNQREVSRHTRGFAQALRSALREDPDVILVGEMRDTETIALAITAAETGHLVFGTLHTSSAAQTVDRIINVFPAGQQPQIRAMLSESLQAVVAQILLKKRGGGRVAAHEILVATSGARSMIREEKTYQLPSIVQTGSRHGMITLEQSVNALVQRRLVDRAVADEVLASIRVESEEPPERAQIRSARRSTSSPRPETPGRPGAGRGGTGRAARPGTTRTKQGGDPRESSANLSRSRLKLPRAKRDKGDVVFVLDTDGKVQRPPPVTSDASGDRPDKPPIRVSGLRRAAASGTGDGKAPARPTFPLPPAPPGQSLPPAPTDAGPPPAPPGGNPPPPDEPGSRKG